MNKKFWLAISIFLIASMALAACQTAATPTEAPTAAATTAATMAPTQPTATLAVGIVLPTKNEPRWIQDQTRFNDALTKAGYTVEILFSEGDSAKEKANVESLISKGIKILIICPQDATAAAAAADEAHAAGVKVISYDRLIRDTASVDYYVTFDSIAVGAQQAQYLVDHAKGTGNPLYLYAGAASDNNAFIFFAGAWGVLQPKIADGTFVIKNSSQAVSLKGTAQLTRDQESQIIGQITTNWDFNTAKNLAEANLTSAAAADKGNVFILAPNDGTARSIADAFAADKDVKSYYVTGQDAEKASVQYIIDGKQSMTVFKDVRTLVNDAINAAIALLKGQAPTAKGSYNNGKVDVPAIQSPVVTVDKANVQSALIDSGYYKASDFTGLGAAAAPTTAAAAITWKPKISKPVDCSAGKTYKISIWHQWDGAYLDAIKQAFADYSAAFPCVTIDLSKPDDVQSALNTAVPAGQGPDILGWANDHIGDLGLKGIIVNLDSLGVTQDFLSSTYEPAAIKGVVWTGKIWALPETQEGIALVYNKDLVDAKYLPTDPMNFDDLLTKATQFQKDKGIPLICNQGLGGSDAYHAAPVWFGFGVPSYVDDQGKVYLNTPEAQKAGDWLVKFAAVSNKEASDQICTAAFTDKKVGMRWTGPWAIKGITDAKVNFGIVPMGKPFVGIKTQMITKNAVDRGNQDVALNIIEYFTSADVQLKLATINKTVPAQTAALKDPTLAADPVLAAFGAAMNLGVPMANTPYASAQWGPVGDATLAIWQGKQTPQVALAAAQAAIEKAVAGMK